MAEKLINTARLNRFKQKQDTANEGKFYKKTEIDGKLGSTPASESEAENMISAMENVTKGIARLSTSMDEIVEDAKTRINQIISDAHLNELPSESTMEALCVEMVEHTRNIKNVALKLMADNS